MFIEAFTSSSKDPTDVDVYLGQRIDEKEGPLDDTPTTFKCNYPGCLKEFHNRWSLGKHERQHAGSKLFKCSICHKQFVQKSSLTRHELLHSSEKPWVCEHDNCGKSFKLKEYLDAHKKTHISIDRADECDVLSDLQDKADTSRLLMELQQRSYSLALAYHEQIQSCQTREQHLVQALQECAIALERSVQLLSLEESVESIPIELLLVAQKYSFQQGGTK